jgi:hypothetical protein
MPTKFLGTKFEGKNQRGRFTSGWDGNTKMNIEEVGHVCMKWKHLAHGRLQLRALVNMGMNFWTP